MNLNEDYGYHMLKNYGYFKKWSVLIIGNPLIGGGGAVASKLVPFFRIIQLLITQILYHHVLFISLMAHMLGITFILRTV